MRYSRFKLAKGPLVVYGDQNQLLKQSARNLTGVDTCNVSRLNLLQLAPGGHLGRLVVFTKDAFEQLDSIFGTYRETATQKGGFQLGRPVMSCADLARIINSDQVQAKLRMELTTTDKSSKGRKNPLKNKTAMQRLNPAAAQLRDAAAKAEATRKAGRAAALKAKRSKAGRKEKALRTKRSTLLAEGLEESFKEAEALLLAE